MYYLSYTSILEARIICKSFYAQLFDDLNVHKNPNLSKSSTFSIITDNYFS